MFLIYYAKRTLFTGYLRSMDCRMPFSNSLLQYKNLSVFMWLKFFTACLVIRSIIDIQHHWVCFPHTNRTAVYHVICFRLVSDYQIKYTLQYSFIPALFKFQDGFIHEFRIARLIGFLLSKSLRTHLMQCLQIYFYGDFLARKDF